MSHSAKQRRIGPLDCIEIVSSPDAPYVILFHGYGADMSDLASLNRMIPTGRPVNWLFPNGPLGVPLGGRYEGRAWFPLRIAELEQAIAAGKSVDLASQAPPGMKKAREMAFDMLEALKVPSERLVLGGFSQGSMLALDLTLNSEQPPAGVVILSGTLVNSDRWRTLAAQRAGLRFFQSHGVHDPILAFAMAERLEKLLIDAGWLGKLVKFDGQHEIPIEVTSALGGYLKMVLPK